eukprot:TRINITY_DN1121_c0_g1_i1.p1 TRINITY_DN1121_c0_g1~~TRINITY_DN1121_c0_g1_i1.p1  ORF type:complete len:480 (-),score=101.40 TRINITY_DN1121_c0_g1_i1:387-1826(-)
MARLSIVCAALIAAQIAVVLATNMQLVPVAENDVHSSLPDLITTAGLRTHLQALQDIVKNPTFLNSRSVANGYNASADYVINTLKTQTSWSVKTQYFPVPIFLQKAPAKLALVRPINVPFIETQEFNQLIYGGSGVYDSSAPVYRVPNYGCSDTDFSRFPAGSIAIIETAGGCDAWTKAYRAQLAKAAAVMIHNAAGVLGVPRSRAKPDNWTIDTPNVQIPAFGVSYPIAKLLFDTQGAVVSFATNSDISVYTTLNVICETTGDANKVIVVGAHLDSVPEGPGIDDNGSGSATILELAIQMSKAGKKPKNMIRFVWWGAEEIGLMGSRYYVRDLSTRPEEIKKLYMALNFDMTGSPNYIRFVLDGATAPEPTREQSVVIMNTFEAYLQYLNVPYSKLDFAFGRSDFVPFADAGVPAGGLFTGADQTKTETERTVHGGFANAILDPCYHKYCDTINNIDYPAFTELARTAAYVVEFYSSY